MRADYPTVSVKERSPGVWRIRVAIPKSRPVWRTFHGTGEGAQAKALQLAASYERNGVPTGSPTTKLAKFLHDKITLQEHALTQGTVERYRRLIRLYICPDTEAELVKLEARDRDQWRLARLSLGQLTAADAAAFQRRLKERTLHRDRHQPTEGRRELGAVTVSTVMHLIRAGLADAVRQGIIERNPWDAVPLIRVRAARVATPPAIRAFAMLRLHLGTAPKGHGETAADAFRRQRLAMLFSLACHTGARRGELLACCWRHVDWEPGAGLLHIDGSLDDTDASQLTVKEPKTRSGRRHVSLDDTMLAELKAWRAQLAPAVLAAGRDIAFLPILPGDPAAASYWPPAAASQAARRVMHQYGLKGSLHSVRHANATQLMAAGVSPANVAGRLGHSSAGVTLRLYDHAMPEHDRQMAGIIAAAMAGRGKA